MKKNVKVGLVGILSIVLSQVLTSCCKTVQCETFSTTSFTVSNFTRQESDTIIIRTYTKGTNFTQKIDSLLVARDKNASYGDFSDQPSTSVLINNAAKYHISSNYDFEFYFPATNTLRRLTEMKDKQSETEYCRPSAQRKDCMNSLESVKVDGVLYSDIPYLLK